MASRPQLHQVPTIAVFSACNRTLADPHSLALGGTTDASSSTTPAHATLQDETLRSLLVRLSSRLWFLIATAVKRIMMGIENGLDGLEGRRSGRVVDILARIEP